jgi:hypothetical protein
MPSQFMSAALQVGGGGGGGVGVGGGGVGGGVLVQAAVVAVIVERDEWLPAASTASIPTV